MENDQDNVSDVVEGAGQPSDLDDLDDLDLDDLEQDDLDDLEQDARAAEREASPERPARKRRARRQRFVILRGEVRGAFTAAGDVLGAWKEDGSRAYAQLARRVRRLKRSRARTDGLAASGGEHHAQALAAQTERAGRAEQQREELQAELASTRQQLATAEAFAERCRNLEAQFSWELLDVDSDLSKA